MDQTKTPKKTVTCQRCLDRGWFYAWNRFERRTAPLVFRCDCALPRTAVLTRYHQRFPSWHVRYLGLFIPEWMDTPPESSWFQAVLDEGRSREDEEFQRRLHLWGWEYFESLHEEYKAIKDEETDSVDVPNSVTIDEWAEEDEHRVESEFFG